MNFSTKINEIGRLIDNYFTLPGDKPEALATRKNFFFFLVRGIPLVATLGIVFFFQGCIHLATAFWIFTVSELFILLIFMLKRKHTILFVLINQYFYILFSFVAVVYFGGILYSGGTVFIGLAGALVSLSFLSPNQIKYLFIIYICSIIIEAFLQPLLVPVPELTPGLNLLLFVLHLLVISFSLYITLRTYLQQSLKAKKMEAEHLKELDKIKTKFYTNITHEFRTPLTVILGLTNPSLKMNSTKLKKNISLIRRNGNRLLQLVNQMLDLSKLEAKAMQVSYIQSDICPFIHSLIEPFTHLANKKNIRFQFSTEQKELNMDFDPEKMESIVSNLLSNAIRYTPQGGSINFSVSVQSPEHPENTYGYSPLPVREYNSSQLLSIRIKDSGPGIEKSEIPKIFERFYQVESDTASRNEGSGLGLLLVKEMVNLLHGNIFISSTPGKGTEMKVLLPISNKAKKTEFEEEFTMQGEGEEVKNLNKTKVRNDKELPVLLIIEDNHDVAAYIKMVTDKKYELLSSENGIKGIEIAQENIPDIIISDILMPGINGYEVCATLKNDFRTSHIPIVLLTARTDKESQITGYEKGADAYVTKPFDPRELLVRLEKLIEMRENLKTKYKTLSLVPEPDMEESRDPEEIFLLKTKEILNRYYSEDSFNAEALSQQLGISRSQLFRKLKALTGLSASRFINFYRLSVAKQKVLKSNLNISEIAYEVGFNDPAYFSRLFTKEFGSAPTLFRLNTSDNTSDHS
ncbi:ATP-binding protein [Maribellus sediminis]|uniref:hybrid sensor histidine kinase/response regulator transcription factor n=1 Tax=Maribellus sediminis TaxID=2696285 RepID=UPI001430A323|nr:ATP-binding protein [Maribellus sediminis]